MGALNGVLGDFLIEQHNPLALPMTLYDHYGSVQKGELAGRIVIFSHGLCMEHLSWSNRHFGGIGENCWHSVTITACSISTTIQVVVFRPMGVVLPIL